MKPCHSGSRSVAAPGLMHHIVQKVQLLVNFDLEAIELRVSLFGTATRVLIQIVIIRSGHLRSLLLCTVLCICLLLVWPGLRLDSDISPSLVFGRLGMILEQSYLVVDVECRRVLDRPETQ